MKELTVDFEHCYGIKKLKHTFKFDKSLTFAIYAPNGSMKTSFAKTFVDFSKGIESKDLIFDERVCKRLITTEGGAELEPSQVFVLEPYSESFSSEKTSSLLVNKALKDQYDKIYTEINNGVDALVEELKSLSGMKKGIEEEISLSFTSERDKLLTALSRVKIEVEDAKQPTYDKINYSVIFNDKVVQFVRDGKFKSELDDYIARYDELLEKSRYFKKGAFNHNNASIIAKSLVDNGFFDASHTVSLSDGNRPGEKSEVTTKEELEQVIQAELDQILSDEALTKAFETIDKKLSKNKELKTFRDYLINNRDVLPELRNIASFRQKVWIDYFKIKKDQYTTLMTTYQKANEELKTIQEQATNEKTKWLEVVDTFNARFHVPFKITVDNKEDVILKSELPIVGFEFYDSKESKKVKKEELISVLSNGEKKALYILNILFEIEARKNDGLESLIIVDDIADSFDYKNKYAIIEYLKDISEGKKFFQIILTHNFDFFRTVNSRFIPRDNCLMIEKSDDAIELQKAEYINNPFKVFMDNLDDDIKLLASIPFTRNLVEYIGGDTDTRYIMLTSILHQKPDSDKIKKADLEGIIKSTFPNQTINITDKNKVITELFIEKADELLGSTSNIPLESKIILSIAIRIKAEKFMISQIKDTAEVSKINNNQTAKLYSLYKLEHPSSSSEDMILKRVNLITPQNIHLNSFMYEPILDMSDNELKDLYKDVSDLTVAP